MTPGAYLFELQYPSNIWNTVLRHLGIPCFMAAKKKDGQSCGIWSERDLRKFEEKMGGSSLRYCFTLLSIVFNTV